MSGRSPFAAGPTLPSVQQSAYAAILVAAVIVGVGLVKGVTTKTFCLPMGPSRAALCSHIGHVVRVSSEKEMIGIHASRIVARVTDILGVGDGATVESETQTVRVPLAFPILAWPFRNGAVALDGSAGPAPTIVSVTDLHLVPKTVFKGTAHWCDHCEGATNIKLSSGDS